MLIVIAASALEGAVKEEHDPAGLPAVCGYCVHEDSSSWWPTAGFMLASELLQCGVESRSC